MIWQFLFTSLPGLPIEKAETIDHTAGSINDLNKPPNDNKGNFDSNSEGNQCGSDSGNRLQWVLIAIILVVPLFLVIIACCCCSCCAFCKICSCLKPSDISNNNIKPAKVYFESKPCIKSQESMDSTVTTDTTCPLFRTLTHPPPLR